MKLEELLNNAFLVGDDIRLIEVSPDPTDRLFGLKSKILEDKIAKFDNYSIELTKEMIIDQYGDYNVLGIDFYTKHIAVSTEFTSKSYSEYSKNILDNKDTQGWMDIWEELGKD